MQRRPITVLKFGSSILRSEHDLPKAVHEIYRFLRKGERVLAVVSAFEGVTDQLIARSREYGDWSDERSSASFIATGESTSAALMALALDRAGIPAIVLDAAQIGLITEGDFSDADLVAVEEAKILARLDEVPVVVVPGFVGRSTDGYPTLLGRGGTDLTALFLAERLHAERCRLLKDVDGLYEWDPASPGPRPGRYRTVSWDEALRLDGKIVQAKATRFARTHQRCFEVAALHSDTPTLVGPGPSTFYPDTISEPPLRVGLLGLGTVGLGVYRELARHPDLFNVVGVAVRRINRIDQSVPKHLLTRDPRQVLEREFDVLVELIGGYDPASALVTAALEKGIHVVTANKSLIATEGPRLATIASKHDARLLYSAAVGGAVPMLEILEQKALRVAVRSLTGILNGTSNFILDATANGAEFEQAVAKAQHRGFAEADPSADLDGTDAAQKLVLLARTAFGIDLHPLTVRRRGIDESRQSQPKHDQVTRLVATAEFNAEGLAAVVQPVEFSRDHRFAKIRGEHNCLLVEFTDGTNLFLHGKGAGRWPTTEAVFADLMTLRNRTYSLAAPIPIHHRTTHETSHTPCSF